MTPHWFLQSGKWQGSEEKNLYKLKNILEEAGCKVAVDKHFALENTPYPFPEKPDGPVILHGSIHMLSDASELAPKDWYPAGKWMQLANLCCKTYYAEIGEFLLQREYVMLPFGDLPRMVPFLYKTFGQQVPDCSLGPYVFIRPDNNEKSFIGAAVGLQGFKYWYDDVAKAHGPGALVVVAPFQQIHKEWRLVIARSSPVAASLYKVDDNFIEEEGCPAAVRDFANKVARRVRVAPVWVLDIAETVEGRLAVVELGAVNCAGWYSCDLRAVTKSINEVASEIWQTGRDQCLKNTCS